jgi:hypothetical protein
MDWKPYKRGHLAKSGHGHYFISEKFNDEAGEKRWFLEYEAGLAPFSESGHPAGNIQGFHSLEEAKQAGEKDAKAIEDAL